MKLSRDQVRLLIFHEFRLGRNGSETTRNICHSIGEGTVSIPTVTNWFKKFRDENYEFMDKPHMGREVTIDLELLLKKIEDEPRLSSVRVGEYFHCHHTTICRHLHEFCKTWKWGKWIPHDLTEDQLQRRADACTNNLTSHRNAAWLTNLVTGDETWTFYINNTRKRQWLSRGDPGIPTPKPSQDAKKIMMSVCGVIHWELLQPGRTVTKEFYCEQLERLHQKLKGKQDRVYFLHDNAKAHVAKMTRQKILDFEWILISHPPYSPDISPSDYHLFRSLKAYLSEKKYNSRDHLEADIGKFFSLNSPKFYRSWSMDLLRRWQEVIDTDRVYGDWKARIKGKKF